MPYRRRGSYRNRRAMSMRPVDSMKNVVEIANSTGTTVQNEILVLTVDTAVTTASNQVQRGSNIKAIYLSFDVCGLAATGVRQITNLYLMKNPGANLTAPGTFTVGTSNEKKFVFRQWSFQTMRNQDGNPPFHWEGWIPIPKRYQRFGTDDLLHLTQQTDTAAGHLSGQCIYKWFR